MKRNNLKNHRFGKWTVIKYMHEKRWWCRCDCGRESSVKTDNLTGGKSTQCRTCGPGFSANKLPLGEAALRDLIGRYKASAKVRNIKFDLADEILRVLLTQNCVYCNTPPLGQWPRQNDKAKLNGVFFYNGIDRIDNSKGYIQENCVSCCKKCNYMKREMSVPEFLTHIEKILNNKLEAM